MRATRYLGFPAILLAVLSTAVECRADQAEAHGANTLSVRASLDFRIRIPRVLRLAVHQPKRLVVSSDDIARGHVVVPLDALVHANFRGAAVLHANVDASQFEEVDVRVGNEQGANARAMLTLRGPGEALAVPVEYRIRFKPGSIPGAYAWPVALSLAEP